jgi:hypothetical protein
MVDGDSVVVVAMHAQRQQQSWREMKNGEEGFRRCEDVFERKI